MQIGWAHSNSGKLENADIETLIRRVASETLEDAALNRLMYPIKGARSNAILGWAER